jgi:hypothetical protein
LTEVNCGARAIRAQAPFAGSDELSITNIRRTTTSLRLRHELPKR